MGHVVAGRMNKQIASDLSSFNTTLLSFAGIALFVGIFIIANTFTMLVAQRTKELALLRAVGASRRQVTRSVLIEAFVVGTAAGVTGLVAGIGIGAGLRSRMGTLGATVPDGPLADGSLADGSLDGEPVPDADGQSAGVVLLDPDRTGADEPD